MRDAARRIRDAGIRSVAIAAIFSPLDPGHEREAAAIVAEEIPGVRRHAARAELGRIGLLERENAALLNAALADLAAHHGRGVRAGDRRLRASSAPLYLTQNDGTVMPGRAGHAAAGLFLRLRGDQLDARRRLPLRDSPTRWSSTSAAPRPMSGSCASGFPREANAVVKIGGVRTLFRMPDLFSIGLGGGSHVSLDPVAVGPVSVGYRLTADALVFGGAQLTATDIGGRRRAARYRRPRKGGPS